MLRTGIAALVTAAGVLAVSLPAAATAPPADAADAQRIVVLGEEDVLGDLLALGVEPVAGTASVPDAGFHALDTYDTSEIEPLPIDLGLEHLAGLDPDLIVTLQFWLDQVPEGTLEAVAPVLVVPDGLDSAAQITFLGERFGATDEAEALVADLADAQAGAADVLDGVEVTVAAIYPGPAPAVFVAGPWVVPQVLIDAGATLVPDAADSAMSEADQNGRVYLSTEQVDVLSAPRIVLMQTDLVEGDSAAVDQIMDTPLWALLPAVVDDDVHIVDRLGYPGIEGHIRAIDDLVSLLTDTTSDTPDTSDTSTEATTS